MNCSWAQIRSPCKRHAQTILIYPSHQQECSRLSIIVKLKSAYAAAVSTNSPRSISVFPLWLALIPHKRSSFWRPWSHTRDRYMDGHGPTGAGSLYWWPWSHTRDRYMASTVESISYRFVRLLRTDTTTDGAHGDVCLHTAVLKTTITAVALRFWNIW